jgi:biopolymer transport protein ExbD
MAEINVTPLVDVMLVLLIIFMVTAPLLTSGVEVRRGYSRSRRHRRKRAGRASICAPTRVSTTAGSWR